MSESSRIKYEIAYDKTRQLVLVYPQWRGPRANTHSIGEYTPENPRANLEDYVDELAQAITDALARVGQELDPYKVMITPLDGSPEVQAKDFGGPLRRVPVEEQVPVGADTTAAMAKAEEDEKGEGEPVPSLVTRKLDLIKARADGEAKVKKATKKAAKKSTKD